MKFYGFLGCVRITKLVWEYVWKEITLCLNLAFSLHFGTQTWHLWYSGFTHFYFNFTFFLGTSMNQIVLGLFLTKLIGFKLGIFTLTLVWIKLCERNRTGHNLWFIFKIIASLYLLFSYHRGRFSSELNELVPFLHSEGWLIGYSDRILDFSVAVPRC